MADNINVSERNTLPVLYIINVSTVTLPPHQHYIYLYLYIIIYLYFRNMKPYNERKMKQYRGCLQEPLKSNLTQTQKHTQLLQPCSACAPRVNNKDQCILPLCNLQLNCCVLSPGSKHAETTTMPIHSVLRVSFLFSVFTYLRHQFHKSSRNLE